MTQHQLNEWMAFAMLEPFGARQETWHHARLASWFTNIVTHGKMKAVKATDIFPELKDDAALDAAKKNNKTRGKNQTPEEMMAIMKMWTFAMSS